MWYLPSQATDQIVYFNYDASDDYFSDNLQAYNYPGQAVTGLSNTPSAITITQS
jgi:hypothetical protein